MALDANSAIVAQMNQLKSNQSSLSEKYKQDEITDDARLVARHDAILWGKAYKKYLEEYKEEARLIINNKILVDADKTESLDLDESMFFELPSPSLFTNGGK